ncbi:MAG: TIGR01777 family protein [Alteromonadaceae bacterium]|nr:TIGR01777 family protein [Alteromonadaceae bacterium]
MKILITGGSGLIGRHFIKKFGDQYQFTLLTRSPEKCSEVFSSNIKFIKALPKENSFDVIINLAGEPIADKRWTKNQKQLICQSRWHITQQLVDMVEHSSMKPLCFISGSAVGYYGDTGEQTVTEESDVTQPDFAHSICREWENIALNLKEQTRVVLLRTGVVLAKDGGALKKMYLPFYLGLGGKIGSGEQWMPWIHIEDMINAIEFSISNNMVKGAINCTSPTLMTNLAFTRALGGQLKRPTFFTVPAFLIKVLMGQVAELLLTSQKVSPEKLLSLGFHFIQPEIKSALENILV